MTDYILENWSNKLRVNKRVYQFFRAIETNGKEIDCLSVSHAGVDWHDSIVEFKDRRYMLTWANMVPYSIQKQGTKVIFWVHYGMAEKAVTHGVVER
jgi:hypothetical protein